MKTCACVFCRKLTEEWKPGAWRWFVLFGAVLLAVVLLSPAHAQLGSWECPSVYEKKQCMRTSDGRIVCVCVNNGNGR